MKKLFLFVVFSAAVISFTACSKDDNGGTSSDLVGKWQLEKMGSIVNDQEIMIPYQHSCSTKKDFVEFLANGVMKSVDYDDDCESYEEQGRWERSGDNLTLTDDDNDKVIYKILNLNSSTLKIEANEDGYHLILELKRV